MDELQEAALTSWLSGVIPGDGPVRIEGLDRIEFGHSAEMLALQIVTGAGPTETRRDVVVRLRPPEPGLLEPYDLGRQYEVLRALAPTAVRVPGVLAHEPTGSVLGRPFFVMDRVDVEVFEQEVPEDLGPERIGRMTEEIVDQVAAIHGVDLDATGLRSLGDGATYVDRELDRWEAEVLRVQRGPLPALELLGAELRAQRPPANPRVTLVHGDAKPGNFGFAGDRVAAVFDWELTDVGDPLADIGYLEVLWGMPVGLNSRPGALTADEAVARYEAITGAPVVHRGWYRAFQGYKMAVIMLLGAMLFDAGHRDDLRMAHMGFAVPFVTDAALRELGVDESPDHGPTAPTDARMLAHRAGSDPT